MSEYLTSEQTAAEVKVSTETLRAWRARGMGPRWFKLPGTRRALYAAEDVRAWIDEAREASVRGVA